MSSIDKKSAPRSARVDSPIATETGMNDLVKAFDWGSTALGPAAAWSTSLNTAAGIVLASRFPMLLWWGPQLIQIYNDAYRPILGDKHPSSLGAPGAKVWHEIWDILGPQARQVIEDGEATWNEHLLLPMKRRGFREETYFTFSYSPVPRDDGGVGGVLVTCQETTTEVIDGRQLQTLRALAARGVGARSASEVCSLAAEVLEQQPADVPFGLFYLLDDEDDVARLVSCAGLVNGESDTVHREVRMGETGDAIAAAFREALERASPVEVPVQTLVASPVARADAPVPVEPRLGVVVPLARPGQQRCYGFLACAVSAARVWSEEYEGFFGLVADHVAAAIARARATEEEQKRIAALMELDRAKTTFFSNVSHEFRTPLTLILGPIERALAANEELGAGDVEAVHRSALRLLRLVNALLDFARAEAGRLDARFVPTDLAAFTQNVASQFRAAIEAAGMRLFVNCETGSEPAYVDREAWEKLLLNLLSNAFKHTFQGEIAVTVTDDSEGFVLQVSDTGAGIPPDQLAHVFDRFHRVEGAPARTHEGTGIGLSLVREYAQLHGGEAGVTSEVGEGTTFTVRIPRGYAHLDPDRVHHDRDSTDGLEAADARQFLAEAERWGGGRVETGTDAGEGRVLLADDNADMRAFITSLLQRRWTVEAVADGEAALAAARANPPDLVVTDVMMPGLDGTELLQALRSDPSTSGVPVILVSARAGDEARIAALESGAADYIVKPFAPRELVARVATQLELARARAHLQELARAANEANQHKEEFLAMLGHELRNPLAPIVTALQILRLRGTAADEHEVIERQVGHLVRLVDDLLDVSRIAQGKVELKREVFELSTAVERAVEQVSPLLESRRQTMTVDVPERGLSILADPGRMMQVLVNLLTNAARYSPDRSRIEVCAEAEEGLVRVRVVDEGIGIEPELLGQIFERFVQRAQGRDRTRGGLGLGLAIVKNLVELHGGNVWAHSAGPGQGAEFVVELPRAPARPRTADLQLTVVAPPDGHRRILVVDDNADAAEMLAMGLDALGHEVMVAHDGPGALEVAETWRPDLALLDIGLPVMDGFQLATELRAAIPGIQLVAVTGYGQKTDRQRSEAAGFAAHLVKPISLESVVDTIDALRMPVS